MKIAIGSDHAGYELKEHIKQYLINKSYDVVDCGCDSTQSCDYPVYGKKVAQKVAAKEVDFGILVCGTGIGIGIAANKIKNIRCAICSEPVSASLSRQHNNANIISFGSRIIGSVMAETIVDTFLTTEYLGERHQKRIDMITQFENE